MAVLALALAGTACHGPADNLQTVLERHRTAIRRLPGEDRRHLLGYGEPIATESADLLMPADVLTLERAREIALRANPDVHAAQARLQAALARITQARSLYYPLVTFTHNSTRTFHTPASRNRLPTSLQPAPTVPTDTTLTSTDVLTALLNALQRPLLGDTDTGRGDRNSFSEHATAFTVSWTVFDGFMREARILSAKYLHSAAGLSLADVERLLVLAVDAAYYQVQLAEEQLRIARADEEFSREQLSVSERLLGAGRAIQSDVDNFRVRLLFAQTNVVEAEGLRDTGRVALAELMGLSGTELPPTLPLSPLAVEGALDLTAPDAGHWLELAVQNRPDLAQLERIVESRKEDLRAAQGLLMPAVNVSGSWGFDRASNLRYENDDQSSAAGIEFRWDVFTGFRRPAVIRESEALLAESQAMVNRMKLTIEREVRQSVIDVRNAQEQIRLQTENLQTARETRAVVQALYEGGKETLTRLNEVQRDYVEADAQLALARIQLRVAWSNLRAAAAAENGEVFEGPEGEAGPADGPGSAIHKAPTAAGAPGAADRRPVPADP